MSLKQVIKSHTHRQLKEQVAWLDDQLNVPSRSDFYMMQVADEVHYVLGKRPKKAKVSDFFIDVAEFFGIKQKKKKKLTESESRDALAKEKAMWVSIAGGKDAVKVVHKPEAE